MEPIPKPVDTMHHASRFALLRFVVLPSFVASIVEGDVKKTRDEYGKIKESRRRASATRGRISTIKTTFSKGLSRVGSKVGRALSVENGDGTRSSRISRTGRRSRNESLEGGALSPAQVEMIDMALNNRDSGRADKDKKKMTTSNPMRMLTSTGRPTMLKAESSGEERWWMNEVPTSDWEKQRQEHMHDADSEADPHNWITHFDQDGIPYYEHAISRKVSYSPPAGFMEDLSDDEWQSEVDKSNGDKYWYNLRSGRTTWSEPMRGSVDGGERKSNTSDISSSSTKTNSSSTHQRYHPHAKHAPKIFGGGESLWQKLRDSASGADYFFNRITRVTTWTDRSKEIDDGGNLEDKKEET